jgi:hypothetical protein
VRLTLWGTLPELYEYSTELVPVKISEKETKKLRIPFLMNVYECIVTLHQPSGGLDADLTLHHGRLLIANQKGKSPARVRVRVNDPSVPHEPGKEWKRESQAVWDITLEEPNSEVALELIGFFDPRQDYKPLNSPEHWPPTALLKLLALKGQSQVRYLEVGYSFQGPPGPALMEWSSGGGLRLDDAAGGMSPVRSDSPREVARLPEWYGTVYPPLPTEMPKDQRTVVLQNRELAKTALRELNRIGTKPKGAKEGTTLNPEVVLNETLDANEVKVGAKGLPPDKVLAQFLALRCFAALDDLPLLLRCMMMYDGRGTPSRSLHRAHGPAQPLAGPRARSRTNAVRCVREALEPQSGRRHPGAAPRPLAERTLFSGSPRRPYPRPQGQQPGHSGIVLLHAAQPVPGRRGHPLRSRRRQHPARQRL